MAQLIESQFRNLGCVVSSCPTASSIGRRILNEGGNAIDAAVGVGFALTVTYPQAGNIGGGGLMLIHEASGEQHFLDYRETAPRAVTSDMYRDPVTRTLGGTAVCVPGTVAGLAAALERFGTWSWDKVVSLCVPLAESGVWISSRQGLAYQMYRGELERFESTRRVFLDGGRVPVTGCLHKIPELAQTFRTLAERGPEAFYRGRIARQIVQEVQRYGGVMDLEDMSLYEPRWRDPLYSDFHGRTLVTAPLPSAGGFIIQKTLELVQTAGGSATRVGSPDWYLLMARAFRVAFWMRWQIAGDPDHAEPAQTLRLNRMQLRDDLEGLEDDLLESSLSEGLPKRYTRSRSTTHFSVLDRAGNAVSNTYSLNTLFGSKLAVGGAGFLLNASIDDFSLGGDTGSNWYELVDGKDNTLGPRRRPVTSMSPTMLTNASDKSVELIVGAAGGPRIPTMVSQVVMAAEEGPLVAAMHLPRLHHQHSPSLLMHEPNMPEPVLNELRTYGFSLAKRKALGIGAAIKWISATDELSACLDPRFGAWV